MMAKNRIKGLDLPVPTTKEIKKIMDVFKECVYCGSKENLTLEHFVPIGKGGTNDIKNLFICCYSCNASKQDDDFLEWYRIQKFYDKKRERNILKKFHAE